MSTPLRVEMLNRVQDRAYERCLELSLMMADAMTGPDGETVGDVRMSRADRILRFQDFATRGVLDALRVVNEDLHDRMVRQQVDDVAAEERARGREAARYMPPTQGLAAVLRRMSGVA